MSRDSGRFPQSLLIAAAAVACSPLAVAAPDPAALERGAIVTWSTQAPAGQDSGGGEIKTALVQIARGS